MMKLLSLVFVLLTVFLEIANAQVSMMYTTNTKVVQPKITAQGWKKTNQTTTTNFRDTKKKKKKKSTTNNLLRQTADDDCPGSSDSGIYCSLVDGDSAVNSTGCLGFTTNAAQTCLTSSAIEIPAGKKVACCGVAEGCDVTLTGLTIGTSGSFNNQGNTIDKTRDGNFETFFDAPSSSGGWVGLDLGEPIVATVIGVAPRRGWESRLLTGEVQISNYADFRNYYVAAALNWPIPAGNFSYLDLGLMAAFRYIRIYGVAYGNIAEFAVFGCSQPCNQLLNGTLIGSAGSYLNNNKTFDKAHDGNIQTYFDAPGAHGYWVGWDLIDSYQITSVTYTPRQDQNGMWYNRTNGAQMQVTNDPTWTNGVFTVGQVTNIKGPSTQSMNLVTNVGPGAFRYVRIYGMLWGNIAEFEFYGCPAISCVTWTQATRIAPSSSGNTCLANFPAPNTKLAYGNCGSNAPVYIGDFTVGPVQISYVNGAIQFKNNGLWYVNGNTATAYWAIKDANGNQLAVAPGSFATTYEAPGLAQQANAGAVNTFNLQTAGSLYLVLVDSDYSDNYCDSQNAIAFSVTQLQA